MTPEDWLEPRLRGAPPELAAAIRGLLDEASEPAVAGAAASGSDTIPDLLAAAALRGLDGVLEQTAVDRRSRAGALRLLAADASLTFAFEAAADLGLDAVELADRLGPRGALGARLEAAGIEGGPS